MSVTLREVARKCGLAPSTVSDVLNNRRGTWASEETRRRVQEAADMLGYRPNAAARTLRTGKTHVIALVYRADDSAWQYDGIAEAIAEHLGEHGYSLLLRTFFSQASLLEGLEQMARARICDAVVLFGQEKLVAEQGMLLERHSVPFVVKGRHEQDAPHWLQVDYDHEGMMHRAVEHLVQRGHQNIAHLGYPLTDVYQQRLRQGFYQAVQILTGQDADEALLGVVEETLESTEAWLERWRCLPPARRPTAVVLSTGDHVWRDLEYALIRRGGISSSGYADFALVGQATRNLMLLCLHGYSFCDLNHRRIAKTMVRELLLPLLLFGDAPDTPVRRILPELLPVATARLDAFRQEMGMNKPD